MTTVDRYLEAVQQILAHLDNTQRPAVSAAADLVVAAMQNGGTVNCAEIGHGLQGDFLNRAGGLVALQGFSYSMGIHNPVPRCRQLEVAEDADLEQVRFAVNQSNLRAGDVMMVSSVSGRNRGPIELALSCRKAGVKTIGLTSLTYTARVQSLHPSGKRLADAVDVVVDIGAPYGDAGVEVPGYEKRAIPMSGVGMVVAGWMVWGTAMERLATAGTPASTLISHNSEGGPAYNEVSRERYQAEGL